MIKQIAILVREEEERLDVFHANPATLQMIAEMESRIGVKLPEDVRTWLQFANGSLVGPGGIFGVPPIRNHLNMERRWQRHPDWVFRKWVPFASDGCGNYYMIPTQQEFGPGYPVMFVELIHDPVAPRYFVASNIWRFIVAAILNQRSECSWPFDREWLLEHDPDIVKFHGVPLPWDADKE